MKFKQGRSPDWSPLIKILSRQKKLKTEIKTICQGKFNQINC